MKTYKQFMVESITDIVYHSTNKPIDILKSNKFYTSVGNIKKDDKNLNKGVNLILLICYDTPFLLEVSVHRNHTSEAACNYTYCKECAEDVPNI